MSVTPMEFWEVRDVMAEHPWQWKEWMVWRSACIPAPPPESDPAMVYTIGLGDFVAWEEFDFMQVRVRMIVRIISFIFVVVVRFVV